MLQENTYGEEEDLEWRIPTNKTETEEVVLQRNEFRAGRPEAPEWAYFPRLRLLLGWGAGVAMQLWEGEAMPVHQLHSIDGDLREMERFAKRVKAKLAAANNLPFPLAFEDASDDLRIALRDESFGGDSSYTWQAIPRYEDSWEMPVLADRDYRVKYRFTKDGFGDVALQVRAKRMSAQWRGLQRGIGLSPGKMITSAGSSRTSEERKFAHQVSMRKEEYIRDRAQKLYEQPHLRPNTFRFALAEAVRTRNGEVQRKKTDDNLILHRPFTEDEAVRRTCHSTAKMEASEHGFEYRWVDAYMVDDNGVRRFRTK